VGGATVALATGVDAVGIGGLGAASGGVGDVGVGIGGVDSGGQETFSGMDGTVEDTTGTDAGGSDSLSVTVLGRIVGVYVLLLSATLTALATGLERGFDTTLVAYRIGIALPTATATYFVAFVGAGALL